MILVCLISTPIKLKFITKIQMQGGKIVYYAKYLHFIERARTEMIYDRLKLNHNQLKIDFNAIFVVKECNVKYHKSANFEDHIDVCTYVTKKSPVRLNLI